MNREFVKYTLISLGVITAIVAGYYIYLVYKDKK